MVFTKCNNCYYSNRNHLHPLFQKPLLPTSLDKCQLTDLLPQHCQVSLMETTPKDQLSFALARPTSFCAQNPFLMTRPKWSRHSHTWNLEENEGYTKFLDWDNFKLEFQKEFCPANSDAVAINKLESTAYYQKNQSADDHLDEFLDLIAESGYIDPKTLVVKFQRGLDPQTQNAVATMANRQPSDTTPTAWYEGTRNVDQNWASNEAFWSVHHIPNLLHSLPSSAPQPSIIPAHVRPTPANPVPVEVDMTWRKMPTPLSCYHCGKPRHKVPDCPLWFDIRALTIGELEAEFKVRLAKQDVVSIEDCPSITVIYTPPPILEIPVGFWNSRWIPVLYLFP